MKKRIYSFILVTFGVLPTICFAANSQKSVQPTKLTESLEIPAENREKTSPPTLEQITPLVLEIVKDLHSIPATGIDSLFFPEAAFLILKDLPNPKSYFDQLMQTFKSDFSKVREKLKTRSVSELTLEKIILGSCKWKETASEYNKIPYWSCYRNKITTKNKEGEKAIFEIHTIINWGKNWYVTHLGSRVETK